MGTQNEDVGNPCPKCGKAESVLTDVTMGATHESWGGHYTSCNYTCVRSGKAIGIGEKVDACGACRCFWRRGDDCTELPAILTSGRDKRDYRDLITYPAETVTVSPVVDGSVGKKNGFCCSC